MSKYNLYDWTNTQTESGSNIFYMNLTTLRDLICQSLQTIS